jgi:hypothetical protein
MRSLSMIASALVRCRLAHVRRFLVNLRLEILGRSFFCVLNWLVWHNNQQLTGLTSVGKVMQANSWYPFG